MALAALLSEATVDAAALKAGISPATLYRWLAEPEFKGRYRAARREVVEHAVSGLQRASSKAVEALERNLTSGAPSAEIAAAKAVLDFAVRGVELVDLAERIEALERASAQATDTKGRSR